jgi:hypothetical protein
MTDPKPLTQLKEMLASNLIRTRKEGIKMADEMLANDTQPELVRALLTELAKSDPMIIVREAAKVVLDLDGARRNPPPAKSPDYIFQARCPDGHVNYYDKRVYCPRRGNVPRSMVSRGGKNLDEVLIKCTGKACGKEFSVEVDCEGYR